SFCHSRRESAFALALALALALTLARRLLSITPQENYFSPTPHHTLYTLPMLSTDARARLTIVLVGARNPSNIGAAARAMQDFGFSDLRIVNDFAAPFEAAQLEAAQSEPAADPAHPKSAVAAHHVMRHARRFDTLAPAIADCSLIVATTAIGDRQLHHPILTLQQAAPHILAALTTSHPPPSAQDSAQNPGAPCLDSETWVGDQPHPTPPRVALLFGSEKTGLTKDQLSHATLLTTIPMFAPDAARHLSMNLGQSVAVCLYELTRSGFESSIELPILHQAPATADDRERLTHLLLDVLHTTGYTRRFPANSSEPLIRQLAQHLGQTHREAMTLMGILRQILWHETHKPTP
ncbi:MAG: hypothetical protein HIU91_14625, partial [Acidobacteria bacterium]|nr:hypothetical protein [Acidobacteriota bacterium]